LFKNAIYEVSHDGSSLGDTLIEKSSNRLIFDVKNKTLDLGKLGGKTIFFDIKKQ